MESLKAYRFIGLVLFALSLSSLFLYVLWTIVAVIFGATNMYSGSELIIFGFRIYVPPLYWLLLIPSLLVMTLVLCLLAWLGLSLLTLNTEEIKEIEKRASLPDKYNIIKQK